MNKVYIFILVSWCVVGILMFINYVYEWHKYRKNEKYWNKKSFSQYLTAHAEEWTSVTLFWPVAVFYVIALVIADRIGIWRHK